MSLPADDDRTVLLKPPPASDKAKVDEAQRLSDNGLMRGQRLGEFEIIDLVGEGGFGIVYLANDESLGRQVAVKEYMPSSLASRVESTQVIVKSHRHEETFKAGLSSFINEARMLARFDHHSVVKVHRFWEANGTAYMVMPYYRGLTLKQELASMTGPAPEAWLKQLMQPLLEALDVLHAGSCFHRDIAPDNILLLQGTGSPLLLDFGAARHVIGDFTQNLTVILKPGYAPIEQYAEIASLRQGPWTDLYALAAVLHCALTGRTPPASVSRAMHDDYVPLALAACKGGTTALGELYSADFLAAIDRGLGVKPIDRWQSAAEFAEALGLAGVMLAAPSAGAVTGSVSVSEASVAGAGVTTTTLKTATSPQANTQTTGARTSHGKARNAAVGTPALARTPPSKWTLVGIAALVVVALSGGGLYFASRSAKPDAPQSTAATATATATATAQTDVAQSVAGASRDAVTSASAVMANASTAANKPLGPFTIASEFARITSLGDASIDVTAQAQSKRVRIGHDRLGLTLQSGVAGYAYVFLVDPGGQYAMLFPNQLDEDNRIDAATPISLPHANWPMVAGPPSGVAHFLVLVSAQPRNFTALGLNASGVFASLPETAIAAAANQRTSTASPFTGRVTCTASVGCDQRFGASTFDMEIVQ